MLLRWIFLRVKSQVFSSTSFSTFTACTFKKSSAIVNTTLNYFLEDIPVLINYYYIFVLLNLMKMKYLTDWLFFSYRQTKDDKKKLKKLNKTERIENLTWKTSEMTIFYKAIIKNMNFLASSIHLKDSPRYGLSHFCKKRSLNLDRISCTWIFFFILWNLTYMIIRAELFYSSLLWDTL